MFVKVITILAVVAVTSAAPQHQEAARYPAGVDPSSCPNFPICDNAALHNPNKHNQWNAQPHNQWNAQPQNQWNAQPHNQWNAQPHNQWDDGQWNPTPAPQWNQWNHNSGNQWNSAPAVPAVNNHLASAGGDKYPAGVNPQSCPNYPFCDNNGHHSAPQVAPLPGWTERVYPAGVSAHECPNFPYCH